MRLRELLIAVACAAAAALGGADPGHATVTPLLGATADRPEQPAAYALAGDRVLVALLTVDGDGLGRSLRLAAVPFGGGAGESQLSFAAPVGSAIESLALAASPSAAALTVRTADEEGTPTAAQTFAGPGGAVAPLSPLEALSPASYLPGRPQVDGDRVFLPAFRGDLEAVRITVREAGGPPSEVSLPQAAVLGDVVFAGELAAWVEDGAREDTTRVRVARWRTGATVRTVTLDADSSLSASPALALAPDGRVVASVDASGLVDLRPGRPPRRLTSLGARPVLAGDTVVAERADDRAPDGAADSLIAAGPTGRVRRIGVPSTTLGGVEADARHVVWSANGCVLSAPLDAGPAVAPDAGPCPRSEVTFEDQPDGLVDARGRVAFVLRCVAAPAPGCQGSAVLAADLEGATLSAPTRLRIPAGASRRLSFRLTAAGRLAARRYDGMTLRATVTDPAGRRSGVAKAVNVCPRARSGRPPRTAC